MRAAILLSFLLMCATAACGGDDDGGTDAGGGDAGGVDSGPTSDAGRDAGPPDTDAGPSCTTGCAFVEVAAGIGHTCARRENGTIRCWGSNAERQLGDGRERHGFDCANSGETELSDCSPPVDVAVIDDATQLTGRGGFSACARRGGDSSVWCWGLQSVSDMKGSDLLPERGLPEMMSGLGPATDVSDGWTTLCAVSGGEARCMWGNSRGQIGNGETLPVRTPFTQPGFTNVTDVEVGAMGAFVCMLLDDGEIWCVGDDDSFQLGNGDVMRTDVCTDGRGFPRRCSYSAVQTTVPMGVTPTQLTLGTRHACFVDDTGQLYCWGDNATGALGTGDNDIKNVPTLVPGMDDVVMARAGLRATCALDGTGQLWCWGGSNNDGVIGDGMMSHGMTCTSGSSTVDCVNTPQMVSGLSDVTTFDMGWAHGCAVRASGEVWCWGESDRRQLSNGADRDPQFAPVMAQGVD